MARQRVNTEINNFIGGLMTDANPINAPENTFSDSDNIMIDRNGYLYRRMGMDYEPDADETDTTIAMPGSGTVAVNTFRWENAGGDSGTNILVVQVGAEVKFWDIADDLLEANVISTETYSADDDVDMSFAVVDGILVAVNGDGTIYTYEYDSSGPTITESTDRLLVRDLWGIEAIDTSTTPDTNLWEGNNISYRPPGKINEHVYNLRNQGFGIPHTSGGLGSTATTLSDPLSLFRSAAENSNTVYPSNAETVATHLAPHPSDVQLVERYQHNDAYNNPPGNMEAPRGYYIIDVLTRGASRQAANDANDAKYSDLSIGVTWTNIVTDSTAGGATVTTEFAGRAWFGGFGAAVTDGDSRSPKLSSYLLFSQVAKDTSDIVRCYQAADPTSVEDSELVPTDGGFVKISGAYNIKALVASGPSLLVLADNGVWAVTGGAQYGFAADNFRVDKISDNGCVSAKSVVFVDGEVYFWGYDGIYHLKAGENTAWSLVDITKKRIQTIFNSVSTSDVQYVHGQFDVYEHRIRWLYNNSLDYSGDTKELVFDTDLRIFYENTLPVLSGNYPKVGGICKWKQYATGNPAGDNSDTLYLVFTNETTYLTYTFALYNDTDFVDFVSFDSTGQDAAAYFVTNAFNTGDTQKRKTVPTLICHFKRTEDGFTTISSTITPDHQSSCYVRARWQWHGTSSGNRWSTARQMYRYRRFYMPADDTDTYDIGADTIISKDTIRGHGKGLALHFYSEAGKNMVLYGWGMQWGVSDVVGS